jgi:hypothetical protein
MTPSDLERFAILVATGRADPELLRMQFRSAGAKVMAMAKLDYDVSDVEPAGVIWADDVKEERIRWLWHGRIPLANVTLLDGDPGLGKSTLALDIAARHTRGVEFPLEERGNFDEPGNVLVVSAEDDIASIIVPRLRAARANMSRIAFLSLREDKTGKVLPFSVPDDIPRLRNALGEIEATFVIVDPIAAFLSEHIHSHNDASIRKAMLPLTMVAQDSGAAIVALRHLNKDDRVTKALYRGGGSIGFSGGARSVLLAAQKPDSDGEMVLAQTKSNLFRRGQIKSLEWRVVSWDEDPDIAKIKWLGTSELSADELLQQYDKRHDSPAQREAGALLLRVLAAGPQPSKRVEEEAKEVGISLTTMKRARRKLQVHTYPERKPSGETEAWFIHLPSQPCPEGAECQWHE